MKPYMATVVGSFPRNANLADTMKRPSMNQEEVDDYIRWAVGEQVKMGLDIDH